MFSEQMQTIVPNLKQNRNFLSEEKPSEKGEPMKTSTQPRLRRALTSALLLLLTGVCAFASACAGGGKTPGDESGEQTAAESGPTALPDIERHIHAISELNTTEYPLDSAAGEEQNSTLMRNFRESYTIPKSKAANADAYYPRIKRLTDGSFLLLFHANGLYGGTVYSALSEDGIEWSAPQEVFTRTPITVNGNADMKEYMDPDACVLSDGRILAVTSYRAGHAYSTVIEQNGVAIKISEDGGKTWGEEQVVYVGTNWEPSVLQADNGEILIFFSCTAPSIYVAGVENFYYRSSGVGCVRSSDGGKSWTPSVTGAPYLPQYVMRQYTGTYPNGIKHYTDQMPVAIQLHNGTIVLAAESYPPLGDQQLRASFSYTNDYFSEDLGLDKTGPADRQSNLFLLTAPYLMQFDSGEVLLTYNWTGRFCYRFADCNARTFYDEKVLYSPSGWWGSCERVSSHSAMITVASEDCEILVSRMYLNHRLHAHKISPTMIASPAEWEASTDALFCGSKSQAQVSVRVGYDENNVYLLAERLDRQITSDDEMAFYLDDGSETGYFRLTVGNEGILSFDYKAKNSAQAESLDLAEKGVSAAVYVDGTVDDRLNADGGVIYEISLPRTLFGESEGLRFLFEMVNSDRPGEKTTTESGNPDASLRDKKGWFTADFE